MHKNEFPSFHGVPGEAGMSGETEVLSKMQHFWTTQSLSSWCQHHQRQGAGDRQRAGLHRIPMPQGKGDGERERTPWSSLLWEDPHRNPMPREPTSLLGGGGQKGKGTASG